MNQELIWNGAKPVLLQRNGMNVLICGRCGGQLQDCSTDSFVSYDCLQCGETHSPFVSTLDRDIELFHQDERASRPRLGRPPKRLSEQQQASIKKAIEKTATVKQPKQHRQRPVAAAQLPLPVEKPAQKPVIMPKERVRVRSLIRARMLT